jgi:hypothetical protein
VPLLRFIDHKGSNILEILIVLVSWENSRSGVLTFTMSTKLTSGLVQAPPGLGQHKPASYARTPLDVFGSLDWLNPY